ncbi:MAG: ribosomal protein L11 methyltransferase [Bacteroidia bacterium]|jgi:ribosomal protein L11 methyltransferase
MRYLEISIPVLDELKEIIMAELDNLGFEGIWDQGSEIQAYIPEERFKHKETYDTLMRYGMENSFSKNVLEEKNWNEEWEKNYDPVAIDTRVLVRSPFHKQDDSFDYQVVIDPKMSFGTGHHATTKLVMRLMLTLDFNNKKVLDMGMGTGVLSFFASMLGASAVIGIDNDPKCVENALENAKYNHVNNVKFLSGSSDAIPPTEFEVVLSNITKNINMQLLPHLAKVVSTKGYLILAGFLNFDLEEVDALVVKLNFTPIRTISIDDWEGIIYQKH